MAQQREERRVAVRGLDGAVAHEVVDDGQRHGLELGRARGRLARDVQNHEVLVEAVAERQHAEDGDGRQVRLRPVALRAVRRQVLLEAVVVALRLVPLVVLELVQLDEEVALAEHGQVPLALLLLELLGRRLDVAVRVALAPRRRRHGPHRT